MTAQPAGFTINLLNSDPFLSPTASITRGFKSIEIVPSTGSLYAIPAGVNYISLAPAGTLATLTIVLPAAPILNTTITVSSTTAITALSITGGANNAPTSMAAASAWTLTFTGTAWRRSG